MPRYARVKTDTKTYHIMMRGINKQVIFHDISKHLKGKNEIRA